MPKISLKLQPILWSKDIERLSLEKDKVYIIHQILSCGNLSHIKWLFKIYPKNTVRQVFINYPKKIYEPSVFYFVKNFILGLKKQKLDEKKYFKSPLRDTE